MPDGLPDRLTDGRVSARLDAPDGAWRTEGELRDAAVLLVLVERDGTDHVLFNVRRHDLPAHAGQVSFPGGARDGDEDAVACALRETEEELGVPHDALRVLARLPDRVSIAGYLVAPFVARLDRPVPYAPDPSEVADVFEVPLRALLEPGRWRFRSLDHPRARFKDIPYFDYHAEHTVWGLTAIITRDFIRAVADFDPGPRRRS
jgi:8-oxo-dGTP pyrophosphatase MutT (NUDIX family)